MYKNNISIPILKQISWLIIIIIDDNVENTTKHTFHAYSSLHHVSREKRRDPTHSYDKSSYTHRKIQKAMSKHKKTLPKNFRYTTIVDRLRTEDKYVLVWYEDGLMPFYTSN